MIKQEIDKILRIVFFVFAVMAATIAYGVYDMFFSVKTIASTKRIIPEEKYIISKNKVDTLFIYSLKNQKP